MTKRKTIAMIDEKVYDAVGRYARVSAASGTVANLMAVIAGAALNKAQAQEIREQLDGLKWRLVELEKDNRRLWEIVQLLRANVASTHDRLVRLEPRQAAKAKSRRS